MTTLKLRDDAYYVPTSEGICILTNSGEVVLTGRSIFQWVERLAPYLDGSHTLSELTASMPAGRRDMTERIISALCERGVVVQAGEPSDADHPLADAARRAYRRDAGFLAAFGPSPERGFQRFRESPAVLVGAGRLFLETVEAALLSGSRRLRVVITGECPTDVSRLAACGRRSRQRDPDQRITPAAVDLPDADVPDADVPDADVPDAGAPDEEQLAGAVEGAGIVIYASGRSTAAMARTLDRLCARAAVPFVPAILTADEAWLGPFGPVTSEGPGWLSGWRRLLAMAGTDAGQPPPAGMSADGPAASGGDLCSGAAPTVVASQLIREAVRLLSGTAEQAGQARMTRIGLRSLRTSRHPFLPHPFSLRPSPPDQAGLAATVARLREGGRLSAEEFSRRVTACLEARLGVLGEVTEADFTQLPLAVSQVKVSDPVLLLGQGVPRPVATGAGLSLADARAAAVLRGLAAYGSLMVDPRRLHVRENAADPRTGDPDRDLTALLARRWKGLTWGHGLADGLAYELPAAAAFPALQGVRSSYVPPPGAAAGHDWQEAVRKGLAGRCLRLTLAEVTQCRYPFTPVEWDQAALDLNGGRYGALVKIIGKRLDVYDVTGSPRLPTLAFCLGGRTVAYACGFSFAEALRDGLAEVLLWYQARASGQAGYAPRRVPPLPARGRLPRVAACPEWSADEASTVARLAQLGWTAVAVPLDHDPGVTGSIMPNLVNVVLTHA